jgi:hypothetical protein
VAALKYSSKSRGNWKLPAESEFNGAMGQSAARPPLDKLAPAG